MTNLKEICGLIESNLDVRAEVAPNQLWFAIALTNGRKQQVLVTIRDLSDGQVIEIVSRCGAIVGAKMVRASLQRNMKSPLGGIAMDTTTEPKTVDCIHRIVVPQGHGVNVPEMLGAITSIGIQADIIEGKLGHEDNF